MAQIDRVNAMFSPNIQWSENEDVAYLEGCFWMNC